MICPHCGTDSEKNVRFCIACGQAVPEASQQQETGEGKLIGYSTRINDPAFARYIKNSKRWSYIFAAILAVIAIAGFYIYGETSTDMDNPQALFIGVGIGGMFLVIALLQSIGRNRSTTWDGAVVDKKSQNKRRKKHSGNNEYYWQRYTLYTVIFKSDDGKTVTENTAEDDDTVYNYYQVGDRVRHHGGLNSFEKYDKSGDSVIFCNACASLNDIQDDVCFRCHCPLLK